MSNKISGREIEREREKGRNVLPLFIVLTQTQLKAQKR